MKEKNLKIVLALTVNFLYHQLLPVGLIILCIISFKTCYFSEMFDWTTHAGYLYLPSWVREIGAMLQLLPLLLVPFVAIIQACRFFLSGTGELHEVSCPAGVAQW